MKNVESVAVSPKVMRSEVTIRFAGAEEAALVAALSRETFHDAFAGHPLMPSADLESYLVETFTVPQMTAELRDSKNIFLLAEIAGEPAGYAKLIIGAGTPGVRAAKPVKLHRLYARQKFIGAGVGAVLIGRSLEEAAGCGGDAIWLSVWEHNLRAQAFYRKWNFEACATVDFQLARSVMTDLVMKRDLD
jgi:diamine N-acetyltransferase